MLQTAVRASRPVNAAAFAYFNAQVADNEVWAGRMGVRLEDMFPAGATVLDFGCGHGALSLAGATLGATVTGIDTDLKRIQFARDNVEVLHPWLADRVTFVCARVESLAFDLRFDAVVSKDTFEHVKDPAAAVAAFGRLLRPGGHLYIGFSPLWHSPFGDHGFLTHRRVPWKHLFQSEHRFLAAHNAHTGRSDRTVADAGFNQWRPADFRRALAENGFHTERVRLNAACGLKRLAMVPLALARRVPALEAYATVSMYLTARKVG